MKTSTPSLSKRLRPTEESSRQTPPSFPLSPGTSIAPPPTPVALNGDRMFPDQIGSPNVALRALSGTCWVERADVVPSNGSAGASRATCWVERGSGCAHPAKADPSGSGFPLSPVTAQASPLSPWMPRRTGRWVPTATAGLFRLDSASIWMRYDSPCVGGAGAACGDLLLVQRP